MELNRRKLIAVLILEIQELANSSSSDSDDGEIAALQCVSNKRRKVMRVHNYVGIVVPALTRQDFKAHFRY